MYNTQIIANAIKMEAKKKGKPIKEILEKCELNINTISEFSKGKQMSIISFAKIADCLECSIDFLLDRKEKFEEYENPSEEQRLLSAFQQLTEEGRRTVLNIAEMSAQNPQYQKYTDIPKEA